MNLHIFIGYCLNGVSELHLLYSSIFIEGPTKYLRIYESILCKRASDHTY